MVNLKNLTEHRLHGDEARELQTRGFNPGDVASVLNDFSSMEMISLSVGDPRAYVSGLRANGVDIGSKGQEDFGYAIRAWINIIRIYRDYEPLKFFGTVGTLIFSLGFLIGIYLIYLHFTTGIVGHFALMMLDVLIIRIGLQIIIFGFIADMSRK